MDTSGIEQSIVIVGGGPAGLMAADVLSQQNIPVVIVDSQKRVGKKFLVAGDGGLNLTHSETLNQFYQRYENPDWAKNIISNFTPTDFVSWLNNMGIDTFIGTSGRVFPSNDYTPAKVLSIWINKLKKQGVTFCYNTSLSNINYPHITLNHHEEQFVISPKKVLFALGGKSWSKTGSNGSWEHFFPNTPLLPSNVGLQCVWSPYFLEKFEGQVLKYVGVSYKQQQRMGDIIITKKGLESTPIYHISNQVIKQLVRGDVVVHIDLKPSLSIAQLLEKVAATDSWQTCFKKWKLAAISKALFVEYAHKKPMNIESLAETVKNLPIVITGHDHFEKAISTQGGIKEEALHNTLNFKHWPHWYAAGEMLNQDGPTGGYLLQHAVSSGFWAGKSMINSLT